MAILNITQFFRPSAADAVVKATDLIHLGRPGNSAGSRDIALTGAELYNSLSSFIALYGAAQSPVNVTPTPQILLDYPNNIGVNADVSTGLITAPSAGAYEIYASVIYSPDGNTQNSFVTLSVQGSSFGNVVVDVKNNSDGSQQIHMSGRTIQSLGNGETVSVYIQASDTRNIVISDTSFELKPFFI